MDFSPEPLSLHTYTVQGAAGELRVGVSKPPGGHHKTALILNGRAEFMEKYRASIQILNSWGYACVILDWRGQGGSWRHAGHQRKAHVDDFNEYLDDLDHVRAWQASMDLDTVDLVIGHSMGGHLVLRALAERGLRARGAVFLAPMFDIAIDLPRWLVRAVAVVGTRLGLAWSYAPGQGDWDPATRSFVGNMLTSDEDLFETFRQLLIHHEEFRVGGVTYGWLHAALRSIARTRTPGYAEALRLPTLVLTGADDRVIDNEAASEMARRLPGGRYVSFAQARHDLLWEKPAIREAVWQEINAFSASLP